MQPEQADTSPFASSNLDAAARDAASAYDRITGEIHKVIVGQDEVIEQMLIVLFCGGHALLVGVPGLAKTLLISTLARTLNLEFSRIQFTPDLMPSDMTGTEVIEENRATGARDLRFVRGPIFANIVLADEINRTPPKTQAALLESMQERQVTTGGVRHGLPEPFFVLATQNPIEQEGTYPLPEAQLDRFMLNIRIDYPTEGQELEVVQRTTALEEAKIEAVLSGRDVLRLQQMVRRMPIAEHVARYAVRIARATRLRRSAGGIDAVRRYVTWGTGPRASQGLVLAAKAKALLGGATHVTPEHIRAAALPVMRHRIILNFNAEADGISTDDLILAVLEAIAVEGSGHADADQLDAVLK